MQHRRVEASLAILGAAGYMSYISERESASRIFITCTREELYSLKDTDEFTDPVLRTLLRMCPGIFADYVYINESRIASQAGCTPQQVYDTITKLRRLKVLEYVPHSSTPLIYMNTAREEPDYIKIPREVYEIRRESMRERIASVLRFVANDGRCRAAKILSYLGEEQPSDCGTCDTCRARRNNRGSTDRLSLRKRVLSMLAGMPADYSVSASTLTEIFYPHGREAIDMLNFLAEQGELVKATYPNGGVFYKPRNATNISKQ